MTPKIEMYSLLRSCFGMSDYEFDQAQMIAWVCFSGLHITYAGRITIVSH